MVEKPLDVTELRVLSDLVNRASLSGSAGLQFGTDRDLFNVLGYKKDLRPRDYRDRFERGGVAATIVEAAPQATWQRDPIIIEDSDPEVSTQFEEEVFELQERLHMWTVFKRADVLAGLGRYSVVLIGAPGEMDQPLENASTDDIIYLAPYSEDEVKIDDVDEDPASSRFGHPTLYSFDLKSREQRIRSVSLHKKVHWSRVIHIADGILDEHYIGTPRLKKCWNYLDDLEKIVGGGSEAFWIRINPGTQFNLDPEMEMTSDQLDALKEETEDFYHGIKRMIRTRGVNINTLQASVSAFNAQVDALLTLISATTRVPKRILMGSERGELASSQDRSNWADQISDRQTQYADPVIVRQALNRFQDIGVVSKVEEYDIKWRDEDVLTDEEKAKIVDRLAGANRKAGETIITGAEIRDIYLNLEPLPEEPEPEPEQGNPEGTGGDDVTDTEE